MAKLILQEDHNTVLKAHGYIKKSDTEFEHPSGHSVTMYKNKSWAHFDPKGVKINSVSNSDDGTFLRSHLNKYYSGNK